PIIASGGVAGLHDIARLVPLEPDGVAGVIVGRALYTGAVKLAEAIAMARGLREVPLSPCGRGQG
ncbi:MAG: 1-(5-phosphoribosyl)-5-((5-phosphoribosylamino)methylideneamino)imidazole-4-carboxamide isomerase, partial [Deltaproteobacteria bacterium]